MLSERRDRLDYHCSRARVGRDRMHIRRAEAYETPFVIRGPRRWPR